jgi:hypothetical protein
MIIVISAVVVAAVAAVVVADNNRNFLYSDEKILLLFFTRVARLFMVQHTKTGENIPYNHQIYQMATKYAR